LRKCQHGDYLKIGEALYFYIHPSFGPKNTFQSYSYIFSSKFGDFIHIFNGKREISGGKKIAFIWRKVDIYFEMKQSGPMVPKRKGLVSTLCWIFPFKLLP